MLLWCAAQGPTLGSLTGDKRDPAGSGSGAEGTGKQAAPLSTMPSAEDIDNMAALLAGKPADGDVRLEFTLLHMLFRVMCT